MYKHCLILIDNITSSSSPAIAAYLSSTPEPEGPGRGRDSSALRVKIEVNLLELDDVYERIRVWDVTKYRALGLLVQ